MDAKTIRLKAINYRGQLRNCHTLSKYWFHHRLVNIDRCAEIVSAGCIITHFFSTRSKRVRRLILIQCVQDYTNANFLKKFHNILELSNEILLFQFVCDLTEANKNARIMINAFYFQFKTALFQKQLIIAKTFKAAKYRSTQSFY